MTVRWLLVPVLTTLALAASPVPAHAQVGHVHMTVRAVDPAVNDSNQLLYEVIVGNLGPDTATHVETIQNVLLCPTPTTPLTGCQNTQPMVLQMRDVAVGGQDVFRTEIQLPGAHAVTVRATFQVLHVDQRDDFSVPGSCNYGQVPQDDCDTNVITLSR